jgi:hypothetical protein
VHREAHGAEVMLLTHSPSPSPVFFPPALTVDTLVF